ncbi:outer membrane surface protein [Geotalea daltonii FRC-32]|uniref:Translocation and assembly module subunit TamA n=1 Tax=Geotalea daltonii (strain DSM 22248 / JCM 15807 / FRC-32) TaxID=316067 RepID=B9LYY6_GEODF|nr:autotransporter assembly complex family protein [Geotalea daltonii]ACM18718.1 outer membrane surface protein [Geotalea daltonii FRC-32]
MGNKGAYLIAMLIALLAFLPPVSMAAESVEIVVTGVEDEARTNVQEALALPPGMVREGKVDRLWLERFARQAPDRVRTALQPFGYYNAQVETNLSEERGYFRLMAQVSLGEPVRISALDVALTGAGAGEGRLKDLVDVFPLEKGDILLQQPYDQAKGGLEAAAEELGFLDARFTAHEIRIDPPRTSARIRLVMDTGERYFFDGATIEGAPDYPESFLRRYLSFKSGEPFSYSRLGQTQLNFNNSERFKEIVVTPHKEEAANNTIPVSVQLKQAYRRSLRPGLGYGTDTGGRFSLRYRDLNMLHRGHEYYANLFISQRLQGFASGYVIPDADDIRSSTSLQLNLQREETTYVSRLVALELDKNRSFGRGELGTAYIRLQRESFTIGSENSSSRLVLPGLRFTKDHYGDLIRPERGFRYFFDVRGTHQLIGSDVGLIQLITEGSDLMPLPWRLSLHTRAKVGLTLLNDPMADLPASLRFFAGGDQSVRGYSYKSLGPRDATGEVVGGRHLLVGSIELERALFKDWGLSVFYDIGNAFNSFTSVKLYSGAGVGVHYYTRVGVVNLSIARQLGVDNPAFHIHFTIGLEL